MEHTNSAACLQAPILSASLHWIRPERLINTWCAALISIWISDKNTQMRTPLSCLLQLGQSQSAPGKSRYRMQLLSVRTPDFALRKSDLLWSPTRDRVET